MSILVGVDVGGTKTTALVRRDRDPDQRWESTGPGAAVRPGRALTSVGPIADVVRGALAKAGTLKCDALVVGAAGAGNPEEQGELARALRVEYIADRVRVTTDLDIALVAAFGLHDPGVVLSAGTGSAAIGRDHSGRLARAGGYGWQMGDEGSGYALARAALGVVGKARDGRGPPSALGLRMLEASRNVGFEALVRWAATATPGAVASLAPVVLECAEAGDAEAHALVESAARDLAALAVSMLPRITGADASAGAGAGAGPVTVALHGGVLVPGRALHRAVVGLLRADQGVAVSDKVVIPAEGALVLAKQQLPQ